MCSKHWAVFNIAIWFALLNNVQSRTAWKAWGGGGVKILCYLFLIYASTRQFCTFWIFEEDGGSTKDRKCIFFFFGLFPYGPPPKPMLSMGHFKLKKRFTELSYQSPLWGGRVMEVVSHLFEKILFESKCYCFRAHCVPPLPPPRLLVTCLYNT